ncbi:Ig-like domain-containing protein [Halovenus sp. HT40]|uniref:Ig-like domain-containing protein n=1 Tax=Halovenus sp. HT40 TaxID=3126691 RepID=UPI00300F4BB6
MSILNIVEDYGATGDGSTDDSQAIQDAINDTTAGDTVVIPETSDHYRIYDDTSGTSVGIYLENAADNVTITGESRDSKLVLDSPDGKSACMGVEDMSGASWTSITVKKLVFDGGKIEHNDGDSNAFAWRVSQTRTGYDILMEDCVFQNSSNEDAAGGAGCPMAYSDGISQITFRNCTANNNDGHGFDPIGTGEGSPSDPECKFIDCEASNNGGISIDFHSGNHLLDGFYGTGNENGMKAGAAGGPVNHITLKRVNHRDTPKGKGFYQTFSETGWTLDVEDALFVGHAKDGFELREGCDCTVTGSLMVDGCNDQGVQVLEGSDLDATNGTVISQNNTNYGIDTGYGDHGGDINIDTYDHYNNEGATDGGTPININTEVNEEQSEIDVPGPNDVGAFASGSTEVDSNDPIFDDWTPRWDAEKSNWTVNSTSSNVENSILELNASSAGRHSLSCDGVGTATDVDILGLVRLPSNDDRYTSYCRLIGRGAGSAGNETGYFVEFRDVPSFGIAKYVDGDMTGLASEDVDITPGDWLYVRFNISGNELKARYWGVGQKEPSDWLIKATDDSIPGSGWAGVGGFPSDTQQWDTFSVGTGGDSAQFVGANNSPSVAWKNPTDGTAVSDTVTIKIAAGDHEDGDGSLMVEYRIDGNSWSTASYNSTSGYYEAKWDSTTVANGDHSLEASVTDSAGTSSSSTITVTTDNAGDAPVVDSLSASEVETSNSDAEFDADWQASDPDGNLNLADIALVRDSDGSTADSASVSISGDAATGTTRLAAAGDDGSGNSYTVELAVTDSNDNTTSATTSTTETEDTGEAPTIHRFSVSEAGRPDPHAEVTVIWDVSDADADLASVDIDVADSSGTIKGVNWTLSGANASDTDSFKVKKGDGKTFDVSLMVTDAAGKATSKTVSVTA